ncbi:NADP-dependent oxidoreductase [Pseudomonas viridiflava]|uniref:NADP-dependent oxidoreductase n=1 Tax=Pseudomonas viridiflava TaxID=33069 RepID=UPI0015E2E157|nr:NADP-dependent oxidoreductase [Pseudomonas viridiflava]MBA1228127.1 NADP-dependent oxidoreductase [Pseudomonas viridiflava]
MKAIRIAAFGGPEVMSLQDVDRPQAQQGEVLVKVMMAGTNPVDYKIREGQYPEVKQDRLPLTLGREVAGVVVQLGEGVLQLNEGDRVFGMIGADGGYAEYARVPAEHLARIPDSLDWQTAAGLPLAGHTAWQALVEHGHLEQGHKVLIHGGSGGVGHLAVQFAKVKGAEVYATASAESLPFLKSLGVDRAIDYKAERFEDICKNFDLVIDLIGGETQSRSWQVLGEGGRLVSTLEMPDAHHPQAEGKTGTRFIADPRGHELTEMAGYVDAGEVSVVIAETFPLEQAKAALDYLANGHVHGKVVLRVHEDT